jgi:hypothetical protein
LNFSYADESDVFPGGKAHPEHLFHESLAGIRNFIGGATLFLPLLGSFKQLRRSCTHFFFLAHFHFHFSFPPHSTPNA